MNKHNTIFNLLVIDNFFENPYDVREFALYKKFTQLENIPGLRTKNMNSVINYKNLLQSLICKFYKIIEIKQTVFHIMRSCDIQRIHTDSQNVDQTNICLSAIIYLNPDSTIDSGTSFYNKNKITCEFEKILDVGNIFNRIIIFDTAIYHTPNSCFGNDIYNSRLTLNFLIECENI